MDVKKVCKKMIEAKTIRELDSIRESLPKIFCDHSDHVFDEIVRKKDSAGRFFFQRSCSICGQASGGMIKSSDVRSFKEYDDVAVKEKYEEYGIINSVYRERKFYLWQAPNERKEEYNKYLDSWEWSEKAYKVMKRANFICEGCLEAEAKEVHHMTYTHIYREFMFELVALCSSCHRRIHGK